LPKSGSEIRVGFFVVLALAIAAYMVLSIHGNPFKKTFELSALYTRVGGVKQGTTVTLAGHQIGQVSRVEPNLEARKVQVFMALGDEYARAILTDATASIIPLGFLGDVMIELTYGRTGVPVESGDVLRGMEPMDLQSIIKGTAGDFREALQSINNVVGNETYQQDLGEILDNLSEFTQTLNTIVVPEDKEGFDELFSLLRETTASIGETSESLRQLLEENRENLTASVGNVRDITDQVKGEIAPDFATASRSFAELGDKLTALTEKIDSFVASNSENASAMISNIKDAAGTLETTLDSARTSLERIEQGPGTLHNIVYKEDLDRELQGALKSARGFFDQFSGLGSGLEVKISAETQWFFDDPDNFEREGEYWIQNTHPPPPIIFEGEYEFERQADNNRLEMDIAGQIWFENYGMLLGADDVGADPELDLLFLGKIPNTGGRVVGGFGVIEGEAGLRLETHLVPDLLSLRVDAVGFTTDGKERLDVSMRGQIWENIHVLGGIESVIGDPETRGFAGLRLEFGKKFGEKDQLAEEDWEPQYDSEVYDDLFDSPPQPPAPTGENPFTEDDALWQEMVPAEEAPSTTP
jgi:phospholipid/cholesterol/gamma-HCH transport system substrate-binding protein